MRRETIYKYVANDGTTFSKQSDCGAYEKKLKEKRIYNIRLAFFKTNDSFTYSISRGYIGDYKHILVNYNNFYFPTDEDAKAFNDIIVGYGSQFKHAGLYVDSGGLYQVYAAEIIEENEERIYALEKENEKLEKSISTCARLLDEGE